MDVRFHYVAKLRQLPLLAVLLVSCLVPMTTATARCDNPGATASRFDQQLKEEKALTPKTAYTGVFEPGQKMQIGLLRWYDPNLQRWINRDPLGESSDLNLYRFVLNNPNSFVDPDGESALGTIGGVVGGMVGGGLGAIGGGAGGTFVLPGFGTIAGGWEGGAVGGGLGFAGGYAWGEWVNIWLGGAKAGPIVCPTKAWHGDSPNPEKTEKRNPRGNREDGKRLPGDPTHGPKKPPQSNLLPGRQKVPTFPVEEPGYTPNPNGDPYTGPPKDGLPKINFPR